MAQGLYDITPLEPFIKEGYILLTPNFRLARRIKDQWDAQRVAAGERVWELLPVQPLESWLLGQWELAVSLGLLSPVTPIGSAQAMELWRQVIYQQESQSSDYHLLRHGAAAELASQARDILRRWQVDMNDRRIRQLFELDRDCGTFLHWLTLFEQRLIESGQCTLIDSLAQLPSIAGKLPAAHVVLVEFDEIAPLLRTGLEALTTGVQKTSPKTARAKRLVHSFRDKRVELQAVATWAADLHRKDPATTVGIVLSDMGGDRISLEYLLRREFDCLGENYNSLPVNFSTSITLAQAPLVRDALRVLAMGLQHTAVPAVVGLLRSRFISLPDAQSALAQKFIRQLYDDGSEVLAIADLRYAAAQVSLGDQKGLLLGHHLLALSAKRELRRDALPSVWAERFSDVLSVWGWPGDGALDSLEYQQLELWYRTLDEFRAFDAVCVTIDFSEALHLLRDCCSRQISQPQTADSPVQVLGPLEAAGLTFDHLWLCGMQGASWPASPRPSPFIPISLQSQLQMPHATPEREWAFSESLLQQYSRACHALHASYCRQIDGVPDLPSALLEGFTLQTISESPLVCAQWTNSYIGGGLEELADHRAPLLDPRQQPVMKGGSSLLEDQSQCPFRAFARHRLNVEPLAAFSVALSPGERGALLHAAMFALFGEICDYSSLHTLNPDQVEQAVARAVQAAIEGVPGVQRRRQGTAYWQLEGLRLASLLHEWLTVERQRSAFSVVQREQDITLELAQLEFRLRVDRVDQLPDGSRVIIDYKSGTSTVQDWLGDRPAKPQLLLYGIAEPESAVALTFAQVRPRECCYVGLGRVAVAPGISTDIARAAKAQMDVDDWTSLNQRWQENLERLARSFVAGEAQVDPLPPSSCSRCGLQSLCRVDTTSLKSVEAEE